jgi:hypothetical protein
MEQKVCEPNNGLDLKELESKAFRSTFQDGFLDIAIGLILLGTSLSITLTDMGTSDAYRISLYVPLMLSGSVLMVLGKRFITVPRMGQVTFGHERLLKIAKLHALIVVSVLVTVVFLGLIIGGLDVGEYTGDIAIAFLIISIFYGISYYLDLPRMSLYGVFLALSNGNRMFRDLETDVPPGLPAFIMAMITLAIGIHLLRSFLNNYPLSVDDGGPETAETDSTGV